MSIPKFSDQFITPMKSSILTAICLMLVISLQSQTITPDEAARVAHNWYYERLNQQYTIHYQDISIKDIIANGDAQHPAQYAVNFYPKGFVLVSAARNLVPVAGYSFESWFNKDIQPENFRAWNNQYIRQAEYAIQAKTAAFEGVEALWQHLLTTDPNQLETFNAKSVEPLTVANWNQDWPYNEMCPADPAGPHGHCYAGCVPTAMGMLMYYYRWPQTGTGSYSYVQEPYGTLSADFGNSTYNWNEMTNSISDSDSAIAQLLYHLGVSCDLVYGPDGSGMYNHKAAYALRTFFKYAPETQYLYRDSTNLNWDSVLLAHLDRRMPMYYAGWSVPNINGHAFVCDGYQGSDYFHFNFGWGGQSNGYFYTSNLSPGGNNFNLAQEVIINCHPDTVNYTYPLYCSGNQSIQTTVGSIEDGSGPRKNYQNGNTCSWLIDPQNEMDSVTNISLQFSKFNTQGTDMVKVYDGADAASPLLASYSGSNIPASVTTTGNRMFVTFTADNAGSGPGFMATYTTEKPVWCYGTTTYTGAEGNISDGSGTFSYYNSSVCLWKILPTGADAVALYFTKFNTEPDMDKVKIYDFGTGELLAEYSGNYDPTNLPDPILSASGKLFITFNTNGSVRNDGWEAYWETYMTGTSFDGTTGSELKLFPVPADNSIYLNYQGIETTPIEIRVTDISGHELFKETILPESDRLPEIDIHTLKPGFYLLHASGIHGTAIGKFVKK